jgi:hypothetical protein
MGPSPAQTAAQDDKPRREKIMTTTANAANITNGRIPMKPGITRTIFRWTHIVFAIPTLGYIYSPFDKLPDYAFKTRFIFVPVMVLSGLWMWKGHFVRRLFSRRSNPRPASVAVPAATQH